MISVCILTKNSAATLKATLDSIQSFPEVIILDTGSSDETLAIAKNYSNVQIAESPFIGFGPLKNKATSLASHDWILTIDSDEVLSPNLVTEIKNQTLNPLLAYRIPRYNFYNGKRIRGCGWGGEQIARLFHRQHAKYSEDQVHESLVAKQFFSLRSPLYHTPYRSTADFLAKMQHYSTLFAEQNQNKKRSSLGIALAHAIFAFFRSYILKRGITGGKEGFIISFYNANTTFYKYLKLAEKNKNKQ